MIEIIGTGLTQWDTGRSVNVTGIEASHVHFANQGDSQAPIIELAESMAKIPDYLLRTGKQLCVYAVNNGVTVESRIFPVRNRERPENYIYEDDQRNYIYKIIEDAENATNHAETVAEELLQAKEKGEFNGSNGITPHIGINGNWWIGDEDTGVSAVGNQDIDDSVITTEKTWSSEKISKEIAKGGNTGENQDFVWLGTLRGFDGTIKQAEIDSMEGLGYIGAFSEFLIFLTLPNSEDIETNYRTQLYIGDENKKWIVYLPQGFNRTSLRKMRLHLHYAGEARWLTDGVFNDNTTQEDYFVPNVSSSNSGFGNIRSQIGIGSTVSKLTFQTTANFPEGTEIEVYGK